MFISVDDGADGNGSSGVYGGGGTSNVSNGDSASRCCHGNLCYGIPGSGLLGDFDMVFCLQEKLRNAKNASQKTPFYALYEENAKPLAF